MYTIGRSYTTGITVYISYIYYRNKHLKTYLTCEGGLTIILLGRSLPVTAWYQ